MAAVSVAAGVVVASGLTVVRYISRAFEGRRTEAVVTNVVVKDAVALVLLVGFVTLGVVREPLEYRLLWLHPEDA
jgi:hypothetical protein